MLSIELALRYPVTQLRQKNPKFLPNDALESRNFGKQFPVFHISSNSRKFRSSVASRDNELASLDYTAGSQVKGNEENEVERLQKLFGSEKVEFKDVGGILVVQLSLRSGSTGRFIIREACFTSYKPKMWHQGTEEFLRAALQRNEIDSEISILGGVSTDFTNCKSNISWKLVDVKQAESNYTELILEPEGKLNKLSVKLSAIFADGGLGFSLNVDNNESQESVSFEMPSFRATLAIGSIPAVKVIGLKGTNYFPIKEETSMPSNKDLKDKTEQLSILDDFVIPEILPSEKSEEAELASIAKRLYVNCPSNLSILDRGLRRMIFFSRAELPHVIVESFESLASAKAAIMFTSFAEKKAVVLEPQKNVKFVQVIGCADDSSPQSRF